MDADFSIELGNDDPVLDFPWTDPDNKVAYYDLKRHPDLVPRLPEAMQFPELTEFLRVVNSPKSMVESAKCDAWITDELAADEEIFGASYKSASYVDLVFSDVGHRHSFPFHELFARRLVELMRRVPETPSSMELCVRRCYFHAEGEEREGFYVTLYVSGFGDDDARARQNWGIGLKLVANALLQLAAMGFG